MALRRAGFLVHLHDEHFAHKTEDVAWLPTVGEREWVVLSKDFRLRTNQIELLALRAARVRAFILKNGNLPAAAMVEIFASKMAKIEEIARSTPAPFIATVNRTRITVLP